VFENKNIDIF